MLRGLHREYPNKLDHVMAGADEVLPPRRLHPAFFGCFDWHSSVHGHWLLARVLRLFPGLPEAGEIVAAVDASLTPANIAAEVAYLNRPTAGTFERTYGWAWLLKLAQELNAAGSAPFERWASALSPLADAMVDRYMAYLPRATYPIRTGVHPNSAFGLAFAHDYAAAARHAELLELSRATAVRFFEHDTSYPAHLEPGGSDFFSPALMEADLMRRVMPPDRFGQWFAAFLPNAVAGLPASLFAPAMVSDRHDYQIVHLDGLNLSRAWCFRNIASSLDDEPLCARLRASAESHAAAGLAHVCSGDYGGEHWLATFAMLALTGDTC